MYCIEILCVYILSFQNQNIYLDQEIEQIQIFYVLLISKMLQMID